MIRIFLALLVLLMASGVMAQKKPTGFSSGQDAMCDPLHSRDGATTWSCKYPKTGKTIKMVCKVPPTLAKSMPKKMSLNELRETCIKGKANG